MENVHLFHFCDEGQPDPLGHILQFFYAPSVNSCFKKDLARLPSS